MVFSKAGKAEPGQDAAGTAPLGVVNDFLAWAVAKGGMQVVAAVELSCLVEGEALHNAVKAMQARHAILRSGIVRDAEGRAFFRESSGLACPAIPVEILDDDSPQAAQQGLRWCSAPTPMRLENQGTVSVSTPATHRWMKEAIRLSLEPLPERGPLMRVCMVRIASTQRSVVFVLLHHAALDGAAFRDRLLVDLLEHLSGVDSGPRDSSSLPRQFQPPRRLRGLFGSWAALNSGALAYWKYKRSVTPLPLGRPSAVKMCSELGVRSVTDARDAAADVSQLAEADAGAAPTADAAGVDEFMRVRRDLHEQMDGLLVVSFPDVMTTELRTISKARDVSLMAALAGAANLAVYSALLDQGWMPPPAEQGCGPCRKTPRQQTVCTSMSLSLRPAMVPPALPSDPDGVGNFAYQLIYPVNIFLPESGEEFWKMASTQWRVLQKQVAANKPMKLVRSTEIMCDRKGSDEAQREQLLDWGEKLIPLCSLNNLGVIAPVDAAGAPLQGVEAVYWWAGGDRSLAGAWLEMQASTVNGRIVVTLHNNLGKWTTSQFADVARRFQHYVLSAAGMRAWDDTAELGEVRPA